MGKRIYVGNLSYTTTEQSLINLFAEHGTVDSCNLITDRDSGQSKGFAFIEMSTDDEAQGAISALSGKELEGRELKVNEAREREKKGGGRGGYGR